MNDDPTSNVGRRVTDGEPLTVREAYGLFTLKSETAALIASIATISSRVAELPSRAELEVRWKRDDERSRYLEDRVREDRQANQEALEKIDGKVEKLLENRLPKWVIPVLGVFTAIAVPIVVLIINHFWK